MTKRGALDDRDTGRSERKARSRKAQRRLVAHSLFAPVLGAWGALLGGLVVMVLPASSVVAVSAAAGLAASEGLARFAMAALAAAALGLPLFFAARSATRRARRREDLPSLAAMAVRHLRPIDPASELGSRRFDDPVESVPFANDAPDASAEPSLSPAEEAMPDPAPAPPRALDLAAFAELPGRNAVWVEEPAAPPPVLEAAPEPSAEPAPDIPAEMRPRPRPAPVPRPVQDRAIAQLRAVPPSELSLIQMVERFAAALHERQSAHSGNGERRPAGEDRDALLAEALRTLAELSGKAPDAPQDDPLRDAVERLQGLRGAA